MQLNQLMVFDTLKHPVSLKWFCLYQTIIDTKVQFCTIPMPFSPPPCIFLAAKSLVHSILQNSQNPSASLPSTFHLITASNKSLCNNPFLSYHSIMVSKGSSTLYEIKHRKLVLRTIKHKDKVQCCIMFVHKTTILPT
jgi:hypothetical protein